jgi:hypothetical protein
MRTTAPNARRMGPLLALISQKSATTLWRQPNPSRVMMRQIARSFAQFEKTRLVTKLRGARERIREIQGKGEGRKSYAERDPELVPTAKRLHRRLPKGHRRSLREIAPELHTMGYSNKQGAPYSASCVKSMVEGPSPGLSSVPHSPSLPSGITRTHETHIASAAARRTGPVFGCDFPKKSAHTTSKNR